MKELVSIYLALIVCISAQSIKNHDFSQIINVTNYGAVPGSGDDYPALQAIFDEIASRVAANQPVNNVYFPSGVYHISNTLQIPPTISVYGANSTITHDGLWSGDLSDIPGVNTIIKLLDNSNCDMIQPYQLSGYDNFMNVTIKDLTLDGNKDNNLINAFSKGIYAPVLSTKTTSGFVIKNILVAKVNGTGIWIDGNYRGIELENCYCAVNNRNGYHFYGNKKINIENCWAAGNDENGFYFKNCSDTCNIDNCISWGNTNNGVYLENTDDFSFVNLQADVNYGNGVAIIASYNLNFSSANFSGNSRVESDPNSSNYYKNKDEKCSEVLLMSFADGTGCYDITFYGCLFGKESSDFSNQLIYGINDASMKPKTNVLNTCQFCEQNYSLGFASENVLQYYSFISCEIGPKGTTPYINPYNIYTTNVSPYLVVPNNLTIKVDTQTSWKQMKLPKIDLVPVNKSFTFKKLLVDNNYVLITPMDNSGVTINNTSGTSGKSITYFCKDITLNTTLVVTKTSGSNWSITDNSQTGYFANEDGSPLDVTSVTEDEYNVPKKFEILQNYPNPFNPSTVIKYSLPKTAVVKIKVFNILGKEVATLFNALKIAGNHQVTFNAANLSSGTYICVIQSMGQMITKKMNLIK